MIVSYVDLNSIEKAKNFVEAAKHCPFDVHLISGNERVDGKSIIGIFCLNLMRPVRLETTAESEAEVRQYLDSFLLRGAKQAAGGR